MMIRGAKWNCHKVETFCKKVDKDFSRLKGRGELLLLLPRIQSRGLFARLLMGFRPTSQSGFTDDGKIARCSASYYLASNLFFGDCHISPSRIPRNSHITEAFQVRDEVVEEPWLMQPSLVSHHFDDTCTSGDIGNESEKLNCSNDSVQNSETLNKSSHGGDSSKYNYNVNGMDFLEQSDSLLTNYMVEEPWIFESVCSSVKEASAMLRSELSNDEVTQIALSEPHQPKTPETLVHEEENNETTRRNLFPLSY